MLHIVAHIYKQYTYVHMFTLASHLSGTPRSSGASARARPRRSRRHGGSSSHLDLAILVYICIHYIYIYMHLFTLASPLLGERLVLAALVHT